MKILGSPRDLEPYGISALTGEACAYNLRLLCDLNARGVESVSQFLGLRARPQSFADPWNRTVDGEDSLGSVMLPRSVLQDLTTFLLFREGFDTLVVDSRAG